MKRLFNVSWCTSEDDSGCCWTYVNESDARAAYAGLKAAGVFSVIYWEA